MGLRLKLFLISGLPLVFFAVLASIDAVGTFSTFRNAKRSRNDLRLVDKISAVVHQSQIERGKSASHLAGGTAQQAVIDQRAITDSHIKEAEEALGESVIALTEKQKIEAAFTSFAALRSKVDAKSVSSKEAVQQYTQVIESLLEVERFVMSMSEVAGVKGALLSLIVLENAKENGGRLLALAASILAKNAPLDAIQSSSIIRLKGEVDASLNSPGLEVSDKTRTLIAQFNDMKEWKEASQTLGLILAKAEVGNFNVDPKTLFTTITACLDHASSITKSQKDFFAM